MQKRSFRVTLLQWLVLFLTAWNGLRLFTAIAWREILVESSARPAPLISALIGAAWMVIGLILLYGILWEKTWTGRMLLVAAAGYSVCYWIERLTSQEPRPNWPFAVVLNLVMLLFILVAKRSMTREMYERENKNPTPE